VRASVVRLTLLSCGLSSNEPSEHDCERVGIKRARVARRRHAVLGSLRVPFAPLARAREREPVDVGLRQSTISCEHVELDSTVNDSRSQTHRRPDYTTEAARLVLDRREPVKHAASRDLALR
jgi:hypothetical protein